MPLQPKFAKGRAAFHFHAPCDVSTMKLTISPSEETYIFTVVSPSLKHMLLQFVKEFSGVLRKIHLKLLHIKVGFKRN